ncbi:MAG: substrate-binding domain-containing protein [Sporichthyaceae bacterium]
MRKVAPRRCGGGGRTRGRGLGILAAARAFGLDFVPVAREPYDLVLRADTAQDPLLAPLWNLLADDAVRRQVDSLGGYCCAQTGQRIR